MKKFTTINENDWMTVFELDENKDITIMQYAKDSDSLNSSYVFKKSMFLSINDICDMLNNFKIKL